MPRVIITGGAGFIGSNLAELLTAKSWEVVAIDDLSHGSLENIKHLRERENFQFVHSDIRKPGLLDRHCQSAQHIVHLAAYKIPRYGNWYSTLAVNNEGTRSVLESASKFSVKTLIASTSDVYGKNSQPPFTEEHDLVLGPPYIRRWAYAASKVFDEQLAMAYHHEKELPLVILRFFGSYGPRNHRSWWGGPQAVFIEQALKGEPITVHGDGKQTRSFCYVKDTITGIWLALNSAKAVGHVINIGSAREIDITSLATKIIELTGSDSKVEYVPYESFGWRYDDVRRRNPDLSKAKRLLGFEPKVELEDGLKMTIAWHRAASRQKIS